MTNRKIARNLKHGHISICEVMGDAKRDCKALYHIFQEPVEVLGAPHETKAALLSYKHNMQILELYAHKQSQLADDYLETLQG